MAAKNDTEALLEYMEVFKEHNEKFDEYFRLYEVRPGQEMKLSKTLTVEALAELDELANKVEEKRKIWMDFCRKR